MTLPIVPHRSDIAPAGLTRVDKLLACIDPVVQSGLEIGALCRPIVAPGTGPIRYADHMDTSGLREKYANDDTVDIDQIVDVSVVWGESTLPQAVGDARFDYVIASHVIEHVPDMVGWLHEVAAVLKPGGVLSLAIPDKRYTFDAGRALTTFSALIESFFLKRRRPSFRDVLDQHEWVVAVPELITSEAIWKGAGEPRSLPSRHPSLIEDLGVEGLRNYFDQIENGHYMDVHVQVLTPESFVAIFKRLADVGLLDFKIAAFYPTITNDMEFFVSLEKLPKDMDRAARRDAIRTSLPS